MMTGAKERYEMRVTADASRVGDLRKAVVAFAEELGFDDTNPIALAVSEAMTNVVVHAYRDTDVGDMRIVACDKPDRLVVVVRDYGAGMLPRADSPGLGLGLPLISTMADDVQIEAAEGSGCLLRMHFLKQPAQQAA
jgi:stage II sporulation protein AB (anti-sigma F factor)